MRTPVQHVQRCRRQSRGHTAWAILLAGGNGQRMSGFTRNWMGSARPKQYCTFFGKQSMLSMTTQRAGRLVPHERILTVIGPGHRQYLADPDGGSGQIIEQPASRGTGPGIFLPATFIMASDPSASVLIFPSDHFTHPENKFIAHIRQALRLVAEGHPLVLLGAVAGRAETDYGWIEAGGRVETEARSGAFEVLRFHEKPDAAKADEFLSRGMLWNTMAMAARLSSLWDWGWACFPEMMRLFDRLRLFIGTPRQQEILEEIYVTMPTHDFSAGLLEQVASQALVLPMDGVLWSDWGRPGRVLESLAQVGRRPAFDIDHVTAAPW